MFQTFANAFSRIFLKTSTTPFAWGWYGIVFICWIWNSYVIFEIDLLKKFVSLSLIRIFGHPNHVMTFSKKNFVVVPSFNHIASSLKNISQVHVMWLESPLSISHVLEGDALNEWWANKEWSLSIYMSMLVMIYTLFL